MKICSSIKELRNELASFRSKGISIGFVPTMGYFHEGHLSLMRRAKETSGIVVVSIFVNPTQFGAGEDFTRYPRDIERDTDLAKQAGADVLFVPSIEEMYSKEFSTYVIVEHLSSVLEGKFRPTHFKGVSTVVMKLLNIVQPDTLFLGQKDAQQCAVIKKMIQELNIPLDVEIVPTARENDGLALSSRNVYLSSDERNQATILYQSLKFAEEQIRKGERNVASLSEQMVAKIQAKQPTKIDYVAFVAADTFDSPSILHSGDTIIIALAVFFGTTRLIDNILLTV